MSTGTSESQPVVVAFDLQLVDVERGLSSLSRARFARLFAWLSMLVVAALVAWRWREGHNPTVLAIVGVVLVAILFLSRDPAKRVARRVFDALPPEVRHVELTLSNAGVSLQAGETRTDTAWSSIVKVVDARHSFLLFESRTHAQIIPKRALISEQYAILKSLVEAHVVPQSEPWWTPEVLRRAVLYALLLTGLWMFYRLRH